MGYGIVLTKSRKLVGVPPGLYYRDDVIPASLQEELAQWVGSTQAEWWYVTGRSGRPVESSRRVIHFGFAYDYTTTSTHKPAPPMPPVVAKLRDRILQDWQTSPPTISDVSVWNQCIVNRYEPGQGIGSHTDNPTYGPAIACYTIMAGRQMRFTRDNHPRFDIRTRPGSIYVMYGQSRDLWKHEMVKRRSDGGVPRELCVSFTFRMVEDRS